MMQRYRFPIAVALTSLALVAALIVAGGLVVGSVVAQGPWFRGPGFGPWAGGYGSWAGAGLPPQLAALHDVPAGERFDHFKGVQVNLTDKDNQPLAVTLTPGTATAVSATSLTIATNDGASRTFSLDDQTVRAGPHARGGAPTSPSSINPGEKVVVVTVNNGGTAAALLAGDFGRWGPGGPFAH
jgi:hypothetical protein